MGNDGYVENFFKAGDNFNPRSLVGNDKVLASSSGFSPNFNPRSLVGNDRTLIDTYCALYCISIHVPSWGTTATCFLTSSASSLFQSTFPRGERRRYVVFPSIPTPDFNPRSLVGNDKRGAGHQPLLIISIHVPSWGTTANFHKYSLFFYAINIIFLLFIIPSLFSLVLFMLLF